MNLLLIDSGQIQDDGTFAVSGEQVEHLNNVLHARESDHLRFGVTNGNMGDAQVIHIDKRSAVLKVCSLNTPPPAPSNITLIVALPRPQSMKKVLHFAVSYGIKKIYFIGTARVEKSFWSSSDMTPDAVKREIILGLEQGVDTVFPEIILRPKLYEFLNSGELTKIVQENEHAVIAHPSPDAQICPKHLSGRTVLLIGPEGGFIPREVERFISCGFTCVNLGAHILRVEFAVSFLCGCIS